MTSSVGWSAAGDWRKLWVNQGGSWEEVLQDAAVDPMEAIKRSLRTIEHDLNNEETCTCNICRQWRVVRRRGLRRWK